MIYLFHSGIGIGNSQNISIIVMCCTPNEIQRPQLALFKSSELFTSEFFSSLNFGQVTDRHKAMYKIPLCIRTGVLKNHYTKKRKDKNPISGLSQISDVEPVESSWSFTRYKDTHFNNLDA